MQDTNRGRQYTFDGFEVTKANRKAFELSKNFSENADSKPLAIFGGTATGKTHLLYAVKNMIEQNEPKLTVLLATETEMQISLVDILHNGGTAEQFREKYMHADVLLVDDIQELFGKKAIQNELILLFNSFYESGKRFMMTSSQKEANCGMRRRLVSRSFWGDFSVISKPYIHAQFPSDHERTEIRNTLLENGKYLIDDFDLDSFKTYYKNVWKYFKRYIGLFNVDRKDIQLINDLNDILNLLFTKALLYTISTSDSIRIFIGGFYSEGVLYIPLPHHAGTSDLEIKIDEFDEKFNKFCEEYQKYEDF